MDQLLARLAAHAPAAVAGGLAVSVLLAKSLTGKSKRRAPVTAQPQPPGVQPGQLVRARLHVLRRQQRVRLHVQVLKQQSPIASPQDTAIAPELPAPALLLGAQPDTAANQQEHEDSDNSPADPSSPAHATDSAAHPTPAAAGTTATSAPSASAAGVTRRSVTIDPAVEAEQATREAAKKQQTLADVLRELHQSKRKNAKLRDRLARLEASLTPAAAAATAAATAAANGNSDGRVSVQGAIGATAATAAVTAAAAALAAAAAATTPRARAGTATAGNAANEQAHSAADAASGAPGHVSNTTDRGIAAGSSSADVTESADADAQGSSDRDAPSKANRSPTKLPSKSPAKPGASTTLTSNRGDQRPKAPNAASLSAQAATAAPSAAPAAATAAPCAPAGAGAAGSAASSSTAESEILVLPSQPSQPSTATEAAPATGTPKAKALTAAATAATSASSAASSSAPGASLVPGEIMRPRVAPGDPVTARPGGSGEGRRGKSSTVLDVMRERKAAKDEQARLVAKLAAQVAEIQSHNAALMDAFRSSNAKLAHLTEENASLRSEMASFKGNGDGGVSTPTNGSELGHFKESLLHPHGRTTQSETPFSDTTSKDGMNASIGGGSSIGGGLFRYRSVAQKRGSAAAAGDGDVSMPGTPASSAVAPPAQSVMALLDTFGGRGF